ncbi:MAG: PKD domain-containing protein [Bacteroidota bacterium]|nr:PKD domain-containing protein [Bacteroidota bacterium]
MNKILYTIVSIVLFFGCETKDDLRDTSFATTSIAPSNLGIDTQISNDNSGEVSITPYGVGISSFYVDKGDESTIDTIGLGSSLTHIYKSGEYTISVTAESPTGLQSTETKDIFVLSNCLSEEFENIDGEEGSLSINILDKYNSLFTNIGKITSSPATNPKHDLTNPSCTVEQVNMEVGCTAYSGLLLNFSNDFTISDTSNLLSLNIFSEAKYINVSVFFIGSQNFELLQTMEKLNQWETLNFDLSTYEGETIKRIILYFDKGVTCDGSVHYFDQIELKS